MIQATNRLIPRWARLYGVGCSPMLDHCSIYLAKDKLPRGLEKRCNALRPLILRKIRSRPKESE